PIGRSPESASPLPLPTSSLARLLCPRPHLHGRPVVSALSLPLLADLLPYRVRPDLLLGVLMTFADVITALNDVVWALPLVILCLLAGLYFALRTRFVQVTGIPVLLQRIVVCEQSADGPSSFQSLMMP